MARIGATARYHPNPDPVRHVWTPRLATRTGVTHLALCGRMIRPRPRDDLGQWDPRHPRSCRECVKAMEERSAAVARRYA